METQKKSKFQLGLIFQNPSGAWIFSKFPVDALCTYSTTLYFKTYSHYCIWFCICIRFLVPVLKCPTRIDRRCSVISGFGCHLELTDTLGLNLMLTSIRYQTRWIPSISSYFIVKFKSYDHFCSRWITEIPVIKQEGTFLISDYY